MSCSSEQHCKQVLPFYSPCERRLEEWAVVCTGRDRGQWTINQSPHSASLLPFKGVFPLLSCVSFSLFIKVSWSRKCCSCWLDSRAAGHHPWLFPLPVWKAVAECSCLYAFISGWKISKHRVGKNWTRSKSEMPWTNPPGLQEPTGNERLQTEIRLSIVQWHL